MQMTPDSFPFHLTLMCNSRYHFCSIRHLISGTTPPIALWRRTLWGVSLKANLASNAHETENWWCPFIPIFCYMTSKTNGHIDTTTFYNIFWHCLKPDGSPNLESSMKRRNYSGTPIHNCKFKTSDTSEYKYSVFNAIFIMVSHLPICEICKYISHIIILYHIMQLTPSSMCC